MVEKVGKPSIGRTSSQLVGMVRREFLKGNKLACTENISAEANRRRMKGAVKGMATKHRIYNGQRIMPIAVREKIAKRHRARLRENVQLEARDLQNMARRMSTELLEILGEIAAHSENDSARIAAIDKIFERAYGKATQTNVNANVDANGKSTDVTSKELDTRIAETLKRVESLTGGEAKEEEGERGPSDVRVSDRDPGSSSLH
jgi:hypothetical protein